MSGCGRLVLLQPAQPDILSERRQLAGCAVVSPAQLYLDLSVLPGGQDAATALYQQIIAPEWKAGSRGQLTGDS